MKLFKTLTLAVGMAIGVTAAANASTVTVNYQNAGNVFGSPNLSSSANISSPQHDGWVGAGPFRLNANGLGDFVAFCIDLGKYMANGQTYTTSSTSAWGAAVDQNIGKLFNTAYAGVDTATEGAAFQIALWEIITDTGSAFNLGGGSFSVLSANAAVLSQASAYLSGLNGAATGNYAMTFLNSSTSQNLVTVSPVPIPAAGGFLAVALGGLFGMRKLRRKTATA